MGSFGEWYKKSQDIKFNEIEVPKFQDPYVKAKLTHKPPMQEEPWVVTWDPHPVTTTSQNFFIQSHWGGNYNDSWQVISEWKEPAHSPEPCKLCGLVPGSLALFKPVSNVPIDFEYCGLLEIVQCRHSHGSIKVQVLNNGPKHGQLLDLFKECIELI